MCVRRKVPLAASAILLAIALAGGIVPVATPASAGIWAWGCMGKLRDERVIFNRNTMIVTSAKDPKVRLRDLANDGPRLETSDGDTFENLGSNDGFEQTMTFETGDDPPRKLTLIEVTSRKTSYRKGHVGRREEYTTEFVKIFRYAPDKEPERKITMQCIEYVLTTCGGPCS